MKREELIEGIINGVINNYDELIPELEGTGVSLIIEGLDLPNDVSIDEDCFVDELFGYMDSLKEIGELNLCFSKNTEDGG